MTLGSTGSFVSHFQYIKTQYIKNQRTFVKLMILQVPIKARHR